NPTTGKSPPHLPSAQLLFGEVLFALARDSLYNRSRNARILTLEKNVTDPPKSEISQPASQDAAKDAATPPVDPKSDVVPRLLPYAGDRPIRTYEAGGGSPDA